MTASTRMILTITANAIFQQRRHWKMRRKCGQLERALDQCFRNFPSDLPVSEIGPPCILQPIKSLISLGFTITGRG